MGRARQIFEMIPTEVLAEIFCHLDKPSKLIARLVSCEWKSLLDEYFFTLNVNLTDDTFKYVQECTLPIERLIVYDLKMDVVSSVDTLSTSRNKFAKSPRQLVFASKNYRSRDSIHPSVSESNIVKILQLNRKVQVLEFEKNSLEHVYTISVNGLCLQNLKELQITLSDSKLVNEKYVLLQLGKMKMPSLQKVKLDSRILTLIFDEDENELFYLHLFQFLAMLTKSPLKSLEFSNNFMLFPFLPQGSSTLPIVPEKLEILKQDLSKIQLLEFSFLFTGHESLSPPFNLGFHVLENQGGLEKMEVNISFGSESLYREVRKAVERNAKSLKTFSLHSCMFLENVAQIDDILQTLQSCTSLESLKLRKYKVQHLPQGFRLKSVKYFEAIGDLGCRVLNQIPNAFPSLEDLKIWNIIKPSQTKLDDLINSLQLILRMDRIKTVIWFVGGCSLRFVEPHTHFVVRRLNHPKNRVYFITRRTQNQRT